MEAPASLLSVAPKCEGPGVAVAHMSLRLFSRLSLTCLRKDRFYVRTYLFRPVHPPPPGALSTGTLSWTYYQLRRQTLLNADVVAHGAMRTQ